jgi:hypothetical protein
VRLQLPCARVKVGAVAGRPNATEGLISDLFSVKFCDHNHIFSGGPMDDSVARDAKRLLLRYGAPIAVVDKLSDDERIGYARSILRTPVPDRPGHLRDLLSDDGRMAAR